MKMVEFWDKKEVVLVAQQKLILGGVGFSGIAVIVCVCVMNKDPNQIDILIYEKQYQI